MEHSSTPGQTGQGTSWQEKDFGHPRTVSFSACRFSDRSNFAGVFRVSLYPCHAFVMTYYLSLIHI